MTDVFAGWFKRAFPVEAGAILAFSPIYDNNYGWGEPFYDTSEPPLPINEPFGTALDSTKNHDNRNKTSSVSGATAITVFGDQSALFPGNNTWTDGVRTLNWWSGNGHGTTGRVGKTLPTRGWPFSKLCVGDLGYDDNDLPDQSISIVTAIIVPEVSNVVEDLRDFNNNLWVNGVMYTPVNFHPGTGGRWLTGGGMIDEWIIYNDVNFDITSGNTVTISTEYINAYNTATQEYRLLGSFTYQCWSTIDNMMKVEYSQNGLQFITSRLQNIDLGSYYAAKKGDITLDASGDPLSVTVIDESTGQNAYFYYGYKDNVLELLTYFKISGTFTLEVTDWNVQNSAFFGYVVDRVADPDYPNYLFSMFNDIVSLYLVDQLTGLPDLSAPFSQYLGGLTEFFSSVDVRDVESMPQVQGVQFIPDVGIFSVSELTYGRNYLIALNNDRLNGLFESNGDYTDLGPMLLDPSMAGGRFCCGPLSWSKS